MMQTPITTVTLQPGEAVLKKADKFVRGLTNITLNDVLRGVEVDDIVKNDGNGKVVREYTVKIFLMPSEEAAEVRMYVCTFWLYEI